MAATPASLAPPARATMLDRIQRGMRRLLTDDINILDGNTMMQRAGEMQDTAGVHVFLVLGKAFRAPPAHAQQSLNLGRTGPGDSEFRVLEALLHKDPLPVNTIGPKVWLTPGSISVAPDPLRLVELAAKGRALITKTFREHAAAMEKVAGVFSNAERLTLLTLLKKLGKGRVDG
jgi:MarR family 2-MHQ and catechol resistance regulon transcriptional repressor